MVLPPKCSCRPSLTILRSICIHAPLENNYYKALGLNPSATHAEIKSAYYELSKKHHPDKNQGSEKSAKLFRDITAAYEVLGNEKSRKQYDREQLITRSPESSTFRTKPDYSDDIDRIFYERRKKFYNSRQYQKTPYDFDAWYRAHYVVNENQHFRTSYGFRKGSNQYEYQYQYQYRRPKNPEPDKSKLKKKLWLLYILLAISLMSYAPKILESKHDNVEKNS